MLFPLTSWVTRICYVLGSETPLFRTTRLNEHKHAGEYTSAYIAPILAVNTGFMGKTLVSRYSEMLSSYSEITYIFTPPPFRATVVYSDRINNRFKYTVFIL